MYFNLPRLRWIHWGLYTPSFCWDERGLTVSAVSSFHLYIGTQGVELELRVLGFGFDIGI